MTATVYTWETGDELTAGLEPASVSDQALIVARNIAAGRDESVLLVDDDGEWRVYPSGRCEWVADPPPSDDDSD